MTSLARCCCCRCSADSSRGMKEKWPHAHGLWTHSDMWHRAVSNHVFFLFLFCFLSGILHGAGLWQLPKQLYLPTEEKSAQAPNSHLKYVWYDPRRHSFFPQGPPLLLSSYSLEVRHVFSPLLFLDWLQDLLFFLSPLPLIISAVLFKKKPWRVHYPLSKKKKKKKRVWKDVWPWSHTW